jgi:phenylpyruvate tautomerase PptA (4-oxalocrotonate tautomerase family)
MPFIDCKLSKKISEEQKTQLKEQFGKAISLMHKPESYLMVGICDGYDLYFAGKKVESGAYVAVSLLGKVASSEAQAMTKRVCDVLSDVGCDPSKVYITYQGIENWGHDGYNF